MSQATSGVRRAGSLSQKLRTSLKYFVKPEKPPAAPPPSDTHQQKFVAKVCCQLGTCVCGVNRDALHFFENLKLCCKHIFWKKRKSKECSDARKLLETGLIILEFNMGPASTGSDDEGLSIEGTPPVYLHVGKMNFSTWHFGVLRLYPSAMQHSRALLLEPGLFVHEDQDTFSDVEAFKQFLNFEGVVKMSILTISFQDEDWPSPLVIEDPSLPVAKLKEQSEIIVWSGSRQEEERRKKPTKQPSTSARRTHRGRGQRSAGRGRGTGGRGRRGRKRKQEEVEEQQVLLDENTGDDDDGTFKLIEDLLNQNDDVPSHLSDSEKEDQELQMLVGAYDNIDSDVDHSGDSDHVSISSNIDKDSDKNDQKSESDAKVPDISDSDWDSETGDIAGETAGLSDAVSVGNPMHDPDERPVELEAERIGDDAVVAVVPRPRPPASNHERIPGYRDHYSREIFDIPNLGQLRYYPQHQNITAFCGLRTCEHQPDCRMQRAVAPKGGRASGRPIGLLVAWLQKAKDFDHASGHKHSCVITMEDRVSARSFFETLPNWREFAQFERELADGEPSEPIKSK